ncbi:MAG TPA: hypothetical protein VGT04_05465, partial [Acidobacteriaceae bacterium]|nr:hypothetical protein [Acidobacteriaceae bacterium]
MDCAPVLPTGSSLQQLAYVPSHPRQAMDAGRPWLGMRLWRALGVLLVLSCCGVAAAQTATPVLTQAYDAARDGVNATETTLTPAN